VEQEDGAIADLREAGVGGLLELVSAEGHERRGRRGEGQSGGESVVSERTSLDSISMLSELELIDDLPIKRFNLIFIMIINR